MPHDIFRLKVEDAKFNSYAIYEVSILFVFLTGNMHAEILIS
jgi:hypothetical protein